jgi:hypothetical protein
MKKTAVLFLSGIAQRLAKCLILPIEIVEYCRSDVDILRQACLKFRDILMNITCATDFDLKEDGNIESYSKGGIDPFNHIIIAIMCISVIKLNPCKRNLKDKISHQGEIHGCFPGKRSDGDIYVDVPEKRSVKAQEMQENDFFR